VLKAK
jgi:hypothetical protein